MMNEKSKPPVLSLCIPTYNRALFLDQSLRAVLSQIDASSASVVEVLVLDNASADDTPGVVERAAAEFPHVPLRCIRRPENIGPDANFYDTLRQARGEFVYLLSDDDILLPGALAHLLKLIHLHPDFDAFALNVRLFWDSPDEEDTAQPYTLQTDFLTHDRDEALILMNTHLIFLSCMAFRRANVISKDYSDKVGTVLIQAFFFVDALAPGRGFYATKQPYLAQRAEHAGGYSFFRVFVTNFERVMQYARAAGYSKRCLRQIQDKHLQVLFHFLKIFKSRGHYDDLRPNYLDALRRVLWTYGCNGFSLRYIVPRLVLPHFVFRLIQALNRRLKLLVHGQSFPMPSRNRRGAP